MFWMGPQQSQDHGHKSEVDRGQKRGGDAGKVERPIKDILPRPEGTVGGCLPP